MVEETLDEVFAKTKFQVQRQLYISCCFVMCVRGPLKKGPVVQIGPVDLFGSKDPRGRLNDDP